MTNWKKILKARIQLLFLKAIKKKLNKMKIQRTCLKKTQMINQNQKKRKKRKMMIRKTRKKRKIKKANQERKKRRKRKKMKKKMKKMMLFQI